MSNQKKNDSHEISLHPFQPLPPDIRPDLSESSRNGELSIEPKLYKPIKPGSSIVRPTSPHSEKKKPTIFTAGLMMTYACLGTTIFTFALKAKTFGLVWLLVACCVVGVINYWTIMAGAKASFKVDVDNYSEITQKLLGRKARVILNCILIVYSYACMMCFLALLFPIFGRFIQSVAYNNEYATYSDFSDAKWGKLYIKIPFYIGAALAISLMCLIDDINKLNFSSYISIGTVIYTLFVVVVQCRGYYNYYKKNEYKEDDDSTHANWTDLSQAFKKDLDFFKGIANLFCAYACHPNIFPIYAGFKEKKGERSEGLRKMSISTIFSTCLTTALHILSIVCSFLTDPVTPEDLVIYRKSKDGGKDIFMAIAKFAVFISLIFSLPIYYFTLRLCMADSFMHGKITPKFNRIFTFCSVYGCTIVAIIYDKILNYLSYIGGFISVFICYLIPVLLYIKSHGKPITYWKNLIQFIIAILLCATGVTAGIMTIISDVSG